MMIEAWTGHGSVHISRDCPAIRRQPTKRVHADHANVRCDQCLAALFSDFLARSYKGSTTRDRLLRPHGTHAAFMRHKTHGEDPCLACVKGERVYQAERKRRARARVAA